MRRGETTSSIGTVVAGDTLLLDAQRLSSSASVLSLGSNLPVAGITTGSNSFLWHTAAAVPGATTHWELIGGDLRVTRVKTNVGTVSYALRVALDDSLEIWQSSSNVSAPSFHRRVARFGT